MSTESKLSASPVDLEKAAPLIEKARRVVADENESPVTRALAHLVIEAHDEYVKLDDQIRELREKVDHLKADLASASQSVREASRSLQEVSDSRRASSQSPPSTLQSQTAST